MPSKNQIQSLTNGIFLMGSGLGVLLIRGLLLLPVPRYILEALAAAWGVLLLGTGSRNTVAGFSSIVAGGALLLFGGLLSGLSNLAGIALLVLGAFSLVAGFFSR